MPPRDVLGVASTASINCLQPFSSTCLAASMERGETDSNVATSTLVASQFCEGRLPFLNVDIFAAIIARWDWKEFFPNWKPCRNWKALLTKSTCPLPLQSLRQPILCQQANRLPTWYWTRCSIRSRQPLSIGPTRLDQGAGLCNFRRGRYFGIGILHSINSKKNGEHWVYSARRTNNDGGNVRHRGKGFIGDTDRAARLLLFAAWQTSRVCPASTSSTASLSLRARVDTCRHDAETHVRPLHRQ